MLFLTAASHKISSCIVQIQVCGVCNLIQYNMCKTYLYKSEPFCVPCHLCVTEGILQKIMRNYASENYAPCSYACNLGEHQGAGFRRWLFIILWRCNIGLWYIRTAEHGLAQCGPYGLIGCHSTLSISTISYQSCAEISAQPWSVKHNHAVVALDGFVLVIGFTLQGHGNGREISSTTATVCLKQCASA